MFCLGWNFSKDLIPGEEGWGWNKNVLGEKKNKN